MKERRTKSTIKVIQLLLIVSLLEGLAAQYSLIQIPGEPNNAWLLGLSPSRWGLIGAMAVGVLSMGWLLVISIRDASKLRRPLRFLELLNNNAFYWSIATIGFIGGFLAGFTILIRSPNSDFYSYYVRLAPLLTWVTLISLQLAVAMSYLKFQKLYSLFILSKDGLQIQRIAIRLFLLSLGVRLLFAIPVIVNNTPLKFDEVGYMEVATGLTRIVTNLFTGVTPSDELAEYTYNDGKWPPLHPAIMAINMLIWGESLAVARLTVVVISALTTPLVYIFTVKISNQKAGKYAALAHIFYPSFIAYSHYLWSETTYIFFLLAAAYTAVLLVKSEKVENHYFFAIMTGVLLGLSGMVRTTTLPYLIVLPVWIFFAMKKVERRPVYPAIVFILCLMVWIPWLSFLQQKEGRIMPLATTGGYNLYLGNNPWGGPKNRVLVVNSIDQYSKKNKINQDLAARILAMEVIQDDVNGFAQRSVTKIFKLWNSDTFLMRHIFNLVYPPISPAVILWLWGYVIIWYFLFILLAIRGLLTSVSAKPIRHLIIWMVASAMLLPAISIAITRLHLPLLALLLPQVGIGISELKSINTAGRKITAGVIGLIAGIFIVVTLPNNMWILSPSSYYFAPIAQFDRIFNTQTLLKDEITFRVTQELSDQIYFRIVSNDYYFENNKSKEFIWEQVEKGEELRLIIVSKNAAAPLSLEIISMPSNTRMVIEPIQTDTWRRLIELKLIGIKYFWLGGN